MRQLSAKTNGKSLASGLVARLAQDQSSSYQPQHAHTAPYTWQYSDTIIIESSFQCHCHENIVNYVEIDTK